MKGNVAERRQQRKVARLRRKDRREFGRASNGPFHSQTKAGAPTRILKREEDKEERSGEGVAINNQQPTARQREGRKVEERNKRGSWPRK